MTNRPPPRLSKWIFVAADLLMLGVFGWLMPNFLPPKTTWDYVVVLTLSGLWAYGAYICITPWLVEFKAQTQHLENETMADALAQLQRLEEVGNRVQSATASWQTAHDAAARVTNVAKEIEEKIKADMKDFMEFAERVNNEDKNHLRLEIEKMRRTEGEWLQVVARLLDHTFALNQAGHRSGQANVIAQLDSFQAACRDSVRRLGLIAFAPTPGDLFDVRGHQTEKPDAEVPQGAVVTEVLATGYTYQGQLLRRALVRVAVPEAPQLESAPVEEQASAPEEVQSPVAPEPEPQVEPAAQTPPPEPAAETIHENATEEVAEVSGDVQQEHAIDAPAATVNGEPAEEFTLVAHQSAEPAEPPTRRRARKADPQTTLPF